MDRLEDTSDLMLKVSKACSDKKNQRSDKSHVKLISIFLDLENTSSLYHYGFLTVQDVPHLLLNRAPTNIERKSG